VSGDDRSGSYGEALVAAGLGFVGAAFAGTHPELAAAWVATIPVLVEAVHDLRRMRLADAFEGKRRTLSRLSFRV
jgi:hypothetical protein